MNAAKATTVSAVKAVPTTRSSTSTSTTEATAPTSPCSKLGRPENGGAEKLRVSTTTGRIWLRHDNQDFGILFRDLTEGSQPLWFEALEDGNFSLSWNTANANFQELTLVDNITGATVDMLAHDHYDFQGLTSDYNSRFKVVIGKFTGIEDNENVLDNFAFFDGNEWVVNGEGRLDVVDVMGRVLFSNQLNGIQNRVNLNSLAPGVYVFRLADGNYVKTQKIIIK